MAKIEEKLKKSSRLKGTVEHLRKRKANDKEKEDESSTPQQKSAPGSFTTTAYALGTDTGYELRDSFILDSGVNLHVCNNQERFQEFQPASQDDCLLAGNATIAIKGYGTVNVTLKGPKGL